MVMGNSHNLPMPQFPSSRMKVTIMLSSWGSCETLLFQPPHSLSCPRMCDLCWQHLLTTDEDQEYQHPNSLAPARGCPRRGLHSSTLLRVKPQSPFSGLTETACLLLLPFLASFPTPLWASLGALLNELLSQKSLSLGLLLQNTT